MILRKILKIIRAFARYLKGISDGTVDPKDKKQLRKAVDGLQSFIELDMEKYLEKESRRKRIRRIGRYLLRAALLIELLVEDEEWDELELEDDTDSVED